MRSSVELKGQAGWRRPRLGRRHQRRRRLRHRRRGALRAITGGRLDIRARARLAGAAGAGGIGAVAAAANSSLNNGRETGTEKGIAELPMGWGDLARPCSIAALRKSEVKPRGAGSTLTNDVAVPARPGGAVSGPAGRPASTSARRRGAGGECVSGEAPLVVRDNRPPRANQTAGDRRRLAGSGSFCRLPGSRRWGRRQDRRLPDPAGRHGGRAGGGMARCTTESGERPGDGTGATRRSRRQPVTSVWRSPGRLPMADAIRVELGNSPAG